MDTSDEFTRLQTDVRDGIPGGTHLSVEQKAFEILEFRHLNSGKCRVGVRVLAAFGLLERCLEIGFICSDITGHHVEGTFLSGADRENNREKHHNWF